MYATKERMQQLILEHIESSPSTEALKYRVATTLRILGVGGMPHVTRPAGDPAPLVETSIAPPASLADVRSLLQSDSKESRHRKPAADLVLTRSAPSTERTSGGTNLVELIEATPTTRGGVHRVLTGGTLTESRNLARKKTGVASPSKPRLLVRAILRGFAR